MSQLLRRQCQAYFLRTKLIESLSRNTTNHIETRLCGTPANRLLSTTRYLSSSSSSSSDTDFRPSEELAKERYDSRANEDIERKRARLLYQSRKRGMLENGVILSSFANKYLGNFDAQQLDEYDRLINLPTNDWDIFYWATKTKPTPPEFETPIMDKLREHLKSKVSNPNNSVLGKTRPDDIVMPTVKKKYDLDVDISRVSITDYANELFDDRKKTYGTGQSIAYMTEWRKKFFEHRLKRVLPGPTSMKTLADHQESTPYTQRIKEKDIACENIEPKNMIDSPYEQNIKHHNFMQHLLGAELTDNPIEYDDEAEAWADMLWHRNYGGDDSKISPSQMNCSTCLSKLHCCDPGLDGYVPKEVLFSLTAKAQLEPYEQRCQRCKFSKTYNAQLTHEISEEQYEEFLRSLADKRSVVCVLIDLTDFPGGIWKGLVDLMGYGNRMLIIGNKLDLLPYDGFRMIERVKNSLRSNLSRLRPGHQNLHMKDVMVLSARTGFGVESLVTQLLDMTNSTRDIYLIGCNNSGKSTLFSALLQSDLCAIRKDDILSRVSTYTIPTMGADLLKFPINRAEGWEIETKKRRREIFQRYTEKQERSLNSTTKARQASMPHMSSLINRLDYLPSSGANSLPIVRNNVMERPKFTDDHPLAQIEQKEPFSAVGEEFNEYKFFHQTPSCCHHDQMHNLLTNEERLEVFPNETIVPRKYSIRPLNTIFIAGLARLDLLTSQSNVLFTIFVSKYLPIHVIPTRKADQFYDNFLGTQYLGVPFGNDSRLTAWPGLSSSKSDFQIKGVSQNIGAADIVFSSIGWALVNLIQDNECLVRVFTPEGRGIFLRDPPLLSMANRPMGKKIRDTPVFDHPKYIVETGSRLDSVA